MRFFWRYCLKLGGWKTDLVFPYHHLKKYIIIVAPHTSNWDFIIGLAYRNLLGLDKVKFLGKKELFRFPFGILFRKLGGIPADRQHHTNLVEEVVRIFSMYPEFALALSPEGTRRRVEKLRTGFYFIAARAQVPIVPVGIDWKNKTAVFGSPVLPGDQEKDFESILSFYRNISGKYPAKGLMHL